VVAQMKQYSVSQLPVVSDDGQLVGLVNEVSLLKYLLNSMGTDGAQQPIGSLEVVERSVATVTLDTSVETLLSVFSTSPVAVVIESTSRQAMSILTKIDVLSYLTLQKTE